MIIGFQELYHQHKDKLVVNKPYKVYDDIWSTINKAVVDAAVRGERVKMPYQFGEFYVFRRKRYITLNKQGLPKAPINWSKTKKLKKEGILKKGKFIYHTEPFYCGFRLTFKRHQIIGKLAYKFKSSRTNGEKCKSGAINKLWLFLTENDTNYLRFPLEN